MLRVLIEAALFQLVCCAVCQITGDVSDLSAYDGLQGLQDQPVSLAKFLQGSSEEKASSILQPMMKRKSAYLRFGRSSLPPLDEEAGKPEKRKSYYIRFGKRSDLELGGAVYKMPVASVAEKGHSLSKRKSAYIRFGKRNPLIALEQPSDAAIVATLKRNMARMRYGRR
ncbi:CRE-FLP-6 protein [Aphelenchoides avenae]|nr:CRE-FLP-6 protein [Aphelenchus avenae]